MCDRVTTLRQRAFAVAAANKHTAALVEGGAVFSWGANAEGQLGYGTSDSASNALPRLVEGMKARSQPLCHRVGPSPPFCTPFWGRPLCYGCMARPAVRNNTVVPVGLDGGPPSICG